MKIRWYPIGNIGSGARCLRFEWSSARLWLSFEDWDLVIAYESVKTDWWCWSLREFLGFGSE